MIIYHSFPSTLRYIMEYIVVEICIV